MINNLILHTFVELIVLSMNLHTLNIKSVMTFERNLFLKSFIIVCLLNSLFSYSQVNETNNIHFSFNKNINIEDENGHIITDSVKRFEYLKKKQARIDANNQRKSILSGLTPVPLCTNGTFEEFETVSSTNVLTSFQHIDSEPGNPIQCKSVSATANEDIIQYNPSSMNIMATTVPANHIDEFIGNINAFDQFALKINYKNSYSTLSLIQAKRFKTDNEKQLKFNYKAVLQSILGNAHNNEQPYFKARVINSAGVVVDEFCLIADTENCIFTQAPNLEGDSIVLYTPNWQSGILDISSIPNNEVFTIEFMATRCGLGGHFGYAYIDDICLLHSNENLVGSIELDPLNKICPTLPISVCGSFTIPNSGGINATVTSIVLNVYNASNTVVYTSSAPVTLDLINKRFCFDLVAANLPNIINGTYNVSATINYGLLQTNCSGTSFNSATDDDANPGWDIWFLNCINCNLVVQPASLTLCDTNHDGKEFFNLSNANSSITNPTTGLTFTYYTTLQDATNDTNPITTFSNFESPSKVIFVRVTQNPTCYKITTISLIVKYPMATISGILNICSGSTVLTASSGASYLWGNGATTQSITVNAVGTYTVAVTDSFGCVANGSVTILTNLIAVQPTIVVTQPTCSVSTGSIEITSPASQISFDNGATWVTTPLMTGLSVGTYYIIIRTAAGCTSYPTQIDIVPFLSSFPFYTSVDPTFCGGTGSITITSVASFYSFDDGVTWSNNNIATNLLPGTYNIRTKDTAGCISNYNSVTLFSEFLSPPTYVKNNPYCGNLGSITITTVAAQYSFDGGTTWQTSNTLSGLTSGSYVIKIKDSQGCTSPTVYVYLNDLEYSYPEYTLIDAGCNKYASVTITTPGDLYSFDNGLTWSTNNTMTNLNYGDTLQIIVRKGTSCDSYSTYIYISSTFVPLPIVTNFSTLICDNLNDGNENVNLSSFNTNLVANSTNYYFKYYNTLLGAQNQSATDEITNFSSFNLNVPNKIIYTTVFDNNGCFSIALIDLTLIPTPIITLEDNYFICPNSLIIVRETTVCDSYLWSDGTTKPWMLINHSGTYSLTVTQIHGSIVCTTTKSFTVTLSNAATISQIETVDWTENQNTITVYLNSSSIGDYEYSLDGIHYQDSNVFTNLYGGIYNVYVRDKNGCGIVAGEVFLLNYPKFFTPNEDGFNDTWSVNFSYYEKGIITQIFDRFGKLIKVLNYRESWDGKYNGNMLPSDDYWFVVNRANGKVYKGHFAMKR